MQITLISKTNTKTIYKDVDVSSIEEIYDSISETQSILINRTTLKDFLYSQNKETYKDEFQLVKRYLRSNFVVHKLYFNPRTFEFFPMNKCFLVHHK